MNCHYLFKLCDVWSRLKDLEVAEGCLAFQVKSLTSSHVRGTDTIGLLGVMYSLSRG